MPRLTTSERAAFLAEPGVLMRIATVRGWRMPLGDEPGDGIWHQRYYVEGSRLKRT